MPHFPPDKGVTVEKKLLSTLWLLGNQESYRGVADRFGISKGSLHIYVMTTCKILSALQKDYIKWPSVRELPAISAGFQQRCQFPGVVGAVDGTYIPIPGPSDHRDAYINRKGFPSMHLQVVCDSKLRFLDVHTGWPGAVHDSRVFRNSPLGRLVASGYLPGDYHLIGDSAYALQVYLMVPFRDNGHLSALEKRYNKLHSSTRVDVERSIGLLKVKFRRMKHLDMQLISEIPVVISAACVLHNFILLNAPVDDDTEEPIDYIREEPSESPPTGEMPAAAAVEKRMEIATSLFA